MGVWKRLGRDYPGDDKVIKAVFDVLAPITSDGVRSPVYQVGGSQPTVDEVWVLSKELAEVALKAVRESNEYNIH